METNKLEFEQYYAPEAEIYPLKPARPINLSATIDDFSEDESYEF